MLREPAPDVIQMEAMFATETKRGEAARKLNHVVVASRDPDNLETHGAAGQVASAVGTADAGADAGCHEGVALVHCRGAGEAPALGVCVAVRLEGRGGFAVDAAEGDLSFCGFDAGRGGGVASASVCAFDVEFRAVRKGLVVLEVGRVGLAVGCAAVVVDVAGGDGG